MILSLYKNKGETPKMCMERFVVDNPEYEGVRMTYAGRLDPIAEGVLPVLTGDDVKDKDVYTKKEKEYEAEILLGFDTDTYDILGLATEVSRDHVPTDDIETSLEVVIQKEERPYPPYSSKTVAGKPLWAWAREGRLDEVDIPGSKMKVLSYEILGIDERGTSEVLEYISDTISLVKGDFRQKESIERWSSLLFKDGKVQVLRVRFLVSSGTYIRTLAHELGDNLGVGGVILSLKRTGVGGCK